MIRVQDLEVATPGARAFRWFCNEPYTGVKRAYAVSRIARGAAEYRAVGKRWLATPGTIVLKRPGDVHRDDNRRAVAIDVVVLPAQLVEARAPKLRIEPQLAANDERAVAFHRVIDVVTRGEDRFTIDVALAEAVTAFAALDGPERSPAIRRAIEWLRAHLAEPVTLDELALEIGLDKFHLCHAFRAQLGIPPYAYLTRLRIARARELLARGARPSEIASQLGFCDQSQLHRHFKKIVGVTPGQFARAQGIAPT